MKSEGSGHLVSSNFSHPSYKFNDTTIVTATSIVAASVLIASASIKCDVPHCEKESIMPFPDDEIIRESSEQCKGWWGVSSTTPNAEQANKRKILP